MRMQRLSDDPIVTPAQVWEGLATEAQAGAIQLMARLASNLIAQQTDSTTTEVQTCLHGAVPPRSAPSISTATP
jgi:hypothetical protein